MADRAQRGSFVIFVAAPAQNGAGELEQSLAQAGLNAIPCNDVYDALATLITRPRPLAMVVSIDALDWNELDFFAHVARISPDTPLYVTDGADQPAKLDAALQLGAQMFELALIADYAIEEPLVREAGPAGLLAGSLRTDSEPPAQTPRLVREVPTPPASPAIVAVPNDEEERPNVRLVSSDQTSEPDASVPFPWSPAADRPQRTPPKTAPRESAKALRESKAAREAREAPRPSVKLTPEELSALLEPPSGGKVQEGGS